MGSDDTIILTDEERAKILGDLTDQDDDGDDEEDQEKPDDS